MRNPLPYMIHAKYNFRVKIYIIFTMRLYLARKYFGDVILRMS